jgi:transposase InsO family protein
MRQLTGFEYLHVIVDDYSRLAYAEVLDNLTAACAIAFLRRAVAWYAARGVTIHSVMSDNGSCYTTHVYSDALRRLGLKHLRINQADHAPTAVRVGSGSVWGRCQARADAARV